MIYLKGRVGDDLILDQLQRREDVLHEAASAIDAKASQLFAAAAFLAVQPAVLLTQTVIEHWILWIQGLGCLLLFLVFYFAHDTLGVREYPVAGPSDEWRNETLAQAPEDQIDKDGPALIVWGLILSARARIETIETINDSRLSSLIRGRVTLMLAMAVNFIALGAVGFKHLS